MVKNQLGAGSTEGFMLAKVNATSHYLSVGRCYSVTLGLQCNIQTLHTVDSDEAVFPPEPECDCQRGNMFFLKCHYTHVARLCRGS